MRARATQDEQRNWASKRHLLSIRAPCLSGHRRGMAGRVRESWARGVAGLFEVRAPAAEQKRAQRPVHLRATASTVYRLHITHPSVHVSALPYERRTIATLTTSRPYQPPPALATYSRFLHLARFSTRRAKLAPSCRIAPVPLQKPRKSKRAVLPA